jgi:hypothetical protein
MPRLTSPNVDHRLQIVVLVDAANVEQDHAVWCDSERVTRGLLVHRTEQPMIDAEPDHWYSIGRHTSVGHQLLLQLLGLGDDDGDPATAGIGHCDGRTMKHVFAELAHVVDGIQPQADRVLHKGGRHARAMTAGREVAGQAPPFFKDDVERSDAFPGECLQSSAICEMSDRMEATCRRVVLVISGRRRGRLYRDHAIRLRVERHEHATERHCHVRPLAQRFCDAEDVPRRSCGGQQVLVGRCIADGQALPRTHRRTISIFDEFDS